MLTNMYHAPPDGNFCDEHGNAFKLMILHDCNRHMGCVDESDCMMNLYSIGRWTWKQTNKLFSAFFTLKLNDFIVLASCDSEFSHRLFRLALKMDLILEAGWVPQLQTTFQERHSIHEPTDET